MLADPKQLAAEIRRAVTGPMWHGPAIAEALDGLTYVAATSRPVAGAHSIWEIALHIAAWADIARTRLGPTAMRDPVPSRNWPPVPSPSPSTWRMTVEQIGSAYDALATQVAALDPADFGRIVRGRDYTVETMVRGVIEHGTYHGGQIAILRKALARR
jgi:uncharacterized damage-inducible protein DinB